MTTTPVPTVTLVIPAEDVTEVSDALLYRRCDLDSMANLAEKVGQGARAAELRQVGARLTEIAERLGQTTDASEQE